MGKNGHEGMQQRICQGEPIAPVTVKTAQWQDADQDLDDDVDLTR